MMRIVLGEVQVLDDSGQLVATLTPYGAGKLADKLSNAGFKLVRMFGEDKDAEIPTRRD